MAKMVRAITSMNINWEQTASKVASYDLIEGLWRTCNRQEFPARGLKDSDIKRQRQIDGKTVKWPDNTTATGRNCQTELKRVSMPFLFFFFFYIASVSA